MDTAVTILLAHGDEVHSHSQAGEIGLAIIAIAAMVIPLVVLGFVARAFLRAAKRDEQARR